MSTQKYQVLARRYRPQTFADVVGQEAILQTLKNALKRGFVAHAYLFAGSRGVGKTTLARLFAKALNCASPLADGEPCNSCPSCLDISSGQALDVIEIDGASNRGIDDIRQINETVAFAPSHGKYKIYIIDEVHMLTKEAFNALLKTLEEPPERAKFFFATTEPHKVLPTIISRCQRFDLGRLFPAQIAAKLEAIAKDLQRSVEPDAIQLLSHYADGSLRDAESLFDQILCFSQQTITAADIQSALGLAPQELFFAFDQAFADARFSFAFELVEQLFQSGKDFGHFLEQLVEHYRHLTVCKTLGEGALHFSPDRTARYANSARLYTQPQCLAILDLLIKAEAGLAKSTSQRTALELTLLQILRTKHRIPVEALVRRLSDLEQSLRTGAPAEVAPPELPPAPAISIITAPEPAPVEPPPVLVAPPVPIVVSAPEPAPLPVELPPRPPILVAPPARAPEPPPVPPVEALAAPPIAELKPVPFNPFHSPEAPPAPIVVAAQPASPPPIAVQPPSPAQTIEKNSSLKKHPSHYDTLIRFAAIELEGTIKKK